MLARAQALVQGGRFQEAQAAFREVLAQDPLSVPARIGLAQACAGTGDSLGAVAWLSDACRIVPDDMASAVLLAETLLGQRQYAQALPVYKRLYEQGGSRDRATLLHYGFCLEHVGDVDGAIVQYRDAVTREPGFFEAHVDLAGVLWRVGDFEAALAHATAAANLAPTHPYALRIVGTALLNLNRLDEAEEQLRRALERKPDLALAQLDLAFTLLLAGRLEEGWSWYEKRWNDTARLQRPPFWKPDLEWRGPSQSLQGQRLLVYAEQGLGDVLQFARYLPMLQALGATVNAVVQPELVTLLEHSFPGVVCARRDRALTCDLHAALLDLPGRFGTTLDTIPAQVRYLRAPRDRVDAWRGKLAGRAGELNVGIAWSGFLAQTNNRNRAIALSEWQALFAVPGVQWFSLQKADAGPFTDVFLPAGKVIDLTSEWRDFADSAAMIEQLDLVITVDTSIAHLAGALGKPVWVLLPPNPDFRWLLDREDSPWYPSMRLFRRGFGEERATQMGRVLAALRERIGV